MSSLDVSGVEAGVLDLGALDATPLQQDPFQFIVVPDFVRLEARDALIRDYPKIDTPRNYRLDELAWGPAFDALVQQLQGPEVATHVSQKFDFDVSDMPPTITVRRYAEVSDGNIHTDTWAKALTMLIYFNDEWTHENGALRLLRSADDIEDYVAEVPPLSGTMLAFKRSENSFHGHKRFEGERRMLQCSWVRPSKSASMALKLKRFTTRAAKHLHIDRSSNVGDA